MQNEGRNASNLEHYNRLYLAIIMRYKDLIEENEKLNVAELPKQITPEDPSIVAFANSIKAKFKDYNPERDFYEAGKQAHRHVKEVVETVSLPVEFWLKPSETLSIEAGDLMDKATLLCSIFIALGNITSKIIIATTDSERKIGVYCSVGSKIVYFDIADGIAEFSSREELLENLGIGKNEDIRAYEFNDKMYADIS